MENITVTERAARQIGRILQKEPDGESIDMRITSLK